MDGNKGLPDIITEFDGSGAPTTAYTWLPGSGPGGAALLLSQVDLLSQSTKYTLPDMVGDMTLLTGSTGQVTDTMEWDVDGNNVARTGTTEFFYGYRGYRNET